jgi:hypothetical protein
MGQEAPAARRVKLNGSFPAVNGPVGPPRRLTAW